MRRSQTPDRPAQFKGSLRHYHRSATQRQRTWDDWIEGTVAKPRESKNWLPTIGAVFGILALGGIIAALVIELR